MGLKKRSKVSAQFNMSSLTDIIFLLLIFFMLTSSLVAPNSLNLKLPGSSNNRPVIENRLDRVRISASGNYYLNGRRISVEVLEKELASRARRSNRKYTFVIEPDSGTATEFVVAVMDIALRLDLNGVLATQKS